MTEGDYWIHLEFRLGEEFGGLPELRYRFFWCDGFEPWEYLLEGAAPRITGRVWICNGPAQSAWEFSLVLPGPVAGRDAIDWAALLPAGNTTRWMSFDEERRHVEIEPGAAEPDLS